MKRISNWIDVVAIGASLTAGWPHTVITPRGRLVFLRYSTLGCEMDYTSRNGAHHWAGTSVSFSSAPAFLLRAGIIGNALLRPRVPRVSRAAPVPPTPRECRPCHGFRNAEEASSPDELAEMALAENAVLRLATIANGVHPMHQNGHSVLGGFTKEECLTPVAL
jgi:hypothetical protein